MSVIAVVLELCNYFLFKQFFVIIVINVLNKKKKTPIGLVWDTNMAAISLFWDTNMAVKSCESTYSV